jgi:hypothetical protein
MDALKCIRPNCNGEVNFKNAYGNVTLELENSPAEDARLAVATQGRICGNCSVDLAEWWNRGKR